MNDVNINKEFFSTERVYYSVASVVHPSVVTTLNVYIELKEIGSRILLL